MITINAQIENPDFESALAKGLRLKEGEDISKKATEAALIFLKGLAVDGLEEQTGEAIKTAAEQKKQDFEIVIEAAKEGGK